MSIISLAGSSAARYATTVAPICITPWPIRRSTSGPFRPISLKPLISAVIAPPDFSGIVLVQNGTSKSLYCVRLEIEPTTCSLVGGSG